MARLFNGTSDFLSVADDATLDFANTDKISISIWVRPDTLGANRTIAAKGDAANSSNYGFRIDSTKDLLWFIRTTVSSWNIWESTSTTLFSTGTWSHVVITHTMGTGSSFKLYVDGVDSAGSWTTGTGNDTPAQNSGPLVVGRVRPGADFFDGRLAELAIWKGVALTLNEAIALTRGVRPERARPIDQKICLPILGQDDPEPDWTGNGNSATVTGAVVANHAPTTLFTPKWAGAPLIETSGALTGIAITAVYVYAPPKATATLVHKVTAKTATYVYAPPKATAKLAHKATATTSVYVYAPPKAAAKLAHKVAAKTATYVYNAPEATAKLVHRVTAKTATYVYAPPKVTARLIHKVTAKTAVYVYNPPLASASVITAGQRTAKTAVYVYAPPLATARLKHLVTAVTAVYVYAPAKASATIPGTFIAADQEWLIPGQAKDWNIPGKTKDWDVPKTTGDWNLN